MEDRLFDPMEVSVTSARKLSLFSESFVPDVRTAADATGGRPIPRPAQLDWIRLAILNIGR